MMITITSMKKLQEPDLLLDQPRNPPNNPHNNRYTVKHNLGRTNNGSSGGRSSPRHSPKNRRIYSSSGGPGVGAVPVPLSSPDDSSTSSSTFTTSTLISSPRPSDRLTDSLSNNHLIVDGLDDDNESFSGSIINGSQEHSSRCTRNSHRQAYSHKYPHRQQYHSSSSSSSSQGRSESLSKCNSTSPWIRSSSVNSKTGSISPTSGSRGRSSCCSLSSNFLPDFLKLTNNKSSRRNCILVTSIILILLASVVTFFVLTLHSGRSELSHSSSQPPVETTGQHSLVRNESSLSISSEPTNQLSEGSPVHQSVDETEDDEDDSSYDYDGDAQQSKTSSEQDSSKNLNLKEVSRISWNLLNSNQERGRGGGGGGGGASGSSISSSSVSSSSSGSLRHHKEGSSNLDVSQQSFPNKPPSQTLLHSSFASISGEGEELVLPSKMIFTSGGGDDESGGSPGEDRESGGNSKSKKRSCCRTQKYSQVIKRDGCEPMTITNRMCFGQCVSVWVPGLFASFPVCRPSRSSWKTVTLTCGKNRDRKRRVRIEKVQRCSCMEIETTVPSQMPESRR